MLPEHHVFESLYGNRTVLGYLEQSKAEQLGAAAAAAFQQSLGKAVQTYCTGWMVGETTWLVPHVQVQLLDNVRVLGPLITDAEGKPYGVMDTDRIVPLVPYKHRFWTERGSDYRVFPDGMCLRFKSGRRYPEYPMAQVFFLDAAAAAAVQESRVTRGGCHGSYPASLEPGIGLTPFEYVQVKPGSTSKLVLAAWADGVVTIPSDNNWFHLGHPITGVES